MIHIEIKGADDINLALLEQGMYNYLRNCGKAVVEVKIKYMAADVEKIYKSPEGVVSKYRPRFVGDVHLPDDTYLQEHGWEIIEIILPPKTNLKLKMNRTELKQRLKELEKQFSNYDETTQIR